MVSFSLYQKNLVIFIGKWLFYFPLNWYTWYIKQGEDYHVTIKSELNAWEVENEKGILRIERDDELGALITVTHPDIALKMTALFQVEELHYILNHPSYARIKHGYFSPSIGQKKVLETIFTQESVTGGTLFALTFLSADTTYQYVITCEEWKKILALFSYIVEAN